MAFFVFWVLIAFPFYLLTINAKSDGDSDEDFGQAFAIVLGLQGAFESFLLILTSLVTRRQCCKDCCCTRGYLKQDSVPSSLEDLRTPLQKYLPQNLFANVPLDFEEAMRYRVVKILEDSIPDFTRKTTKITHFGRTVSVKMHCFNDFEQIRRQDKVNYDDFRLSFHGLAKSCSCGSGGASGAIFSRTDCGKYLMKGLTSEEAETLKGLLPALTRHYSKNRSLICRVYGLYSVKALGAVVWFVVMEDVFRELKKVHEKYDLKGSQVNRAVGSAPLSGEVLKDADLRAPILVKRDQKEIILAALQKDSEFLYQHGLMDYSLLLGIEYKKQPESETRDIEYNRHRVLGKPVIANYAFGIIDYLQMYNTEKKCEAYFKTCVFQAERQALSAVPPDYYQKRFFDKMKEIFNEEGNRVRIATMEHLIKPPEGIGIMIKD